MEGLYQGSNVVRYQLGERIRASARKMA